MSKIQWDKTGDRFYETGVAHGVLYPMDDDGIYQKGVPWNGLKAITETHPNSESKPFYADSVKYYNQLLLGDLGLTIEAYTYPDEFIACDGSAEPTFGLLVGQQMHRLFGLAYNTIMGNDIKGQSYGYKLHLIYGAQATPSEKSFQSINDSPDAISFSWNVTTTPIEMAYFKPIASFTIDSNKVNPVLLSHLEDILYGVDTPISINPRLPLPSEVINLLTSRILVNDVIVAASWIIGVGRIGAVSIR